MAGTVVLVSTEPAWALGLAAGWSTDGDAVTAVLLDAAAAAVRPGHAAAGDVAAAVGAGVTVLAHDDALRRRGLERGPFVDGVTDVDLDAVADLVGDTADTVLWL